ncbi:Metallophosphoesterase family protein [Desulfonema limicola]|uniref:Metallophosphoesterase family protein n=1 Tax=Desulfonema limicola TaxID=45656 RepID=A0A975B8M8_9BACT|nr:DNA repair exonuclease [Desulfonema limicola]QTA80883.1 Metallophosphoesterase family protein [Desulfonema limicola]
MFTFIHAADIHLDSPLRNLSQYEGAPVDALRGATRRAMENLVELAVSRKVDFVLISGDLYDGDWKDYNTGLYFVSQMSRLREADIQVCIITGNHDAASRMTRTIRVPDNVFVFPSSSAGTFKFDKIGAAVHGQSFSGPAVKKNLALAYPDIIEGYYNIGMLHTCATGREGHAPYAPCRVEELVLKGYDYWALGHVHQKEVLYENPFIVFPGNIQGRHIKETGAKGCMIVEADIMGGNTVVEFNALDVLRWEKAGVDISDIGDSYQVVENLCMELESLLEENQGVPLAVRVELYGRSAAHENFAARPMHWINQIRSAALDTGGGQIWIEKVNLGTGLPGKNTALPGGPVGEIMSYIDEFKSDKEMLACLGESLNPLIRKLPREMKEFSGIFQNKDPEWIAGVLDSIYPVLLDRLTGKGDIE